MIGNFEILENELIFVFFEKKYMHVAMVLYAASSALHGFQLVLETIATVKHR